MSRRKRRLSPLRRFFSLLGPGLVAGAADDDPSGIATYSIVGAKAGTSMLWTAVLTWPLMAAVQFMCARIGMVTGEGLVGALSKRFPKGVLVLVSLALLAANSINVGADLAGMSEAAQMLTGIRSHGFILVFAAGIAWVTIRCRYAQLARVLKWLALSLFAYVVTALWIGVEWRAVLRDTFIPTWPQSRETWRHLVAILGTTISPYLFVWQASQEVEEEKTMGRRLLSRKGATRREIESREIDVGVGTFFSNVVMYFIILTCALTLHAHGKTDIETSRQAADALKPLAGSFASALYTLGIIGIGLLAIPTLAGSAAYAFAETFHWPEGIDKPLAAARSFYGVVILSMLLGVAIDFLGIRPVQALYFSAVINGILAPFLLVGILLVAGHRRLMEGQPSSRLSLAMVGLTALLMLIAVVAMFIT
jgi:Mn2+/Fe2+ NRAMP family transporter